MTWYFVLLYDKSFAARMMERNNWTMTQFLTGDFVLHLLPFLAILHSISDAKSMNHLRMYVGTLTDLEHGTSECPGYSFLNRVQPMTQTVSRISLKSHDLELIHHCGLYSLFLNLSWALVTQGTFTLDRAYVPLSKTSWNILWAFNAFTHIMSGFLVNHLLTTP
jgi:hypothetical protein